MPWSKLPPFDNRMTLRGIDLEVLGGDKDGPDFPTQAKHIADTIPGAKLVHIPNVGHVPHLEVPDVFEREVPKFLKEQ